MAALRRGLIDFRHSPTGFETSQVVSLGIEGVASPDIVDEHVEPALVPLQPREEGLDLFFDAVVDLCPHAPTTQLGDELVGEEGEVFDWATDVVRCHIDTQGRVEPTPGPGPRRGAMRTFRLLV